LLKLAISGAMTDYTGVTAATSSTTVATDGAAPYLVSATYSDNNDDEKIDRVAFLFSEVTTFTAITGDDWLFGTAGDIGLAGDFAAAECAGSGTLSTITCTDAGTGTVDATASRTGKQTAGGAEPILTYTNNTNNINDTVNNTAGFAKTLTDSAAPIIKTVAIYDTGTVDGLIDKLVFTWTEIVDTNDGVAPVAADMPTTLLPDGQTAVYTGATISDPAGTSTVVTVTGITGQVTDNTAAGSTAISGDLEAKWKDASAINAHSSYTTGNETISDLADPVIASSTPADGATGYSRTGNIEITFSEPMTTSSVTTSTVTASPTMGTLSLSGWASGNTVLTVDPSITLASSTSYTLTVSDGGTVASAASGDSAMTEDTITFSSASGSDSTGGGGGGGGTTSTTPTVTLGLLSDQTGGDSANIAWSIGGSGIDTVALYYSVNSGATYNQIAYNVSRTSSPYVWTVPNIDEDNVTIKVIAYDSGKAQLDSDVSSAFAITTTSALPEEEVGAETAETTTDAEGRAVAADSGATGPSPITGEDEAISTVVTGQFVRAYGFNTIYYIDEDGARRPFWDTNSFFAYADSFDEVVWVTDATLPTMTLGAPMLPAPGVVLVKIQSDPKVYAIDTDNILRWVPDESTANALYGAAWADYIIDLEPTSFARFSSGGDMTASDIVDLDSMKTRMELAALAQ
ncbi:MAG: hypothetical protein UX09_C0056G0001, partial [Candidatus Uhrbacteria bacterium GW2011_GWE2_45_35]